MSLFKARTFWSFDLRRFAGELSGQIDLDDQNGDQGSYQDSNNASFVASVGQFHSIGPHDVFVCANLDGLVCIVQVPKEQELKQISETTNRATGNSSPDEVDKTVSSIENRQLLCAKRLNFPIVDLKCGYFTSALKQSIAVLSFNKLIVYQVKRRPTDLLSDDRPNTASDGFTEGIEASDTCLLINEHLFSHDLKEHHQLDLLANQIAYSIVVLDKHRNGHIRKSRNRRSDKEDRSTSEHDGHSNKSVQQLPQRDNIVVQYTDQFLLTIVDNKKIDGHFELCHSGVAASNRAETANPDSQLRGLARFVGPVPMAYLRDPRCPSLVVALSDRKIYCVPTAKINALSKQSVVQRVAKNLLSDNNRVKAIASDDQSSESELSLKKPQINVAISINIDLDVEASWKFELVYAPLQMTVVQRRSLKEFHSSTQNYSQLLVMSRYNLELFSSTGEHIWSQRFEVPLICMHSYVIEAKTVVPPSGDTSNTDNLDKTSNKLYADRLLSLLSVDCLSNDRSNLLILEEEHIVWSAQVNDKPAQIWRTELQQMSGSLATLSITNGLLNLSYLGTNSGLGEQEDATGQLENPLNLKDISDLTKLEHLDDLLVVEKHNPISSNEDVPNQRKLLVRVRLEASEQWPNVSVESVLSISPESSVATALQNIIVTLEFDEIFKYEQVSDYPLNIVNDGAVEVQLGSCWPDRREPLLLTGRFSMRDSTSAETAEALSGSNQQTLVERSSSMPKSLKVNVHFRFIESHRGLWFQSETFLLPINMIARLVHIDYSTGQNQSLEDIQSNLSNYKRPHAIYKGVSLTDDDTGQQIGDTNVKFYHLCDLFMKTHCDLIDVIDEIIESDLVCRGFNSESLDCSQYAKRNPNRKLSTLENISLLAQSLDCRLKYKSLPHTKTLFKDSSIDESERQVVMISIAFKVPTRSEIIKGIQKEDNLAKFTTLWFHLCDLSAHDSNIPEEVIRQHMKEWKVYEIEESMFKQAKQSETSCPILATIECEYPVPILFMVQHLIERFKKHSFDMSKKDQCLYLKTMTENTVDMIDINIKDFTKMENFIAIDANLHDSLKLALEHYDNDLKAKFNNLKRDLNRGYIKFNITTARCLSLAKRLSNLPADMQQQFNNLTMLTRNYQQDLYRLLSELEMLKRLDYLYSKLPSVPEIVIESKDGYTMTWPSSIRFVD